MFYSGYGVMESIGKKGMPYVKKIPLIRVVGTYFRFDIAIILFVFVQLIVGKTFPVKQYLLSLTGWDAIGNSNWYIFTIVIAYAITYLAFVVGRDKGKYFVSASLLMVGIAAYIFVLHYFNIYLYFVVCLAVTVPMAWAFEKYVGKLWKMIASPKKKLK